MVNKTTKKEVIVVDDDLINMAIEAIQSTEPSAEERQAAQLAKLIPIVRTALDRGDSEKVIREKLKAAIPGLHYSRVNALISKAHELRNESREQPQEGAE